MPRPPAGIYETVIYASDLEGAVSFYRDVLGLALVDGPDPVGAGFRLTGGAMLLIFDPTMSSRPNRPAPSHGPVGAGHVAFHVEASEIPAWRMRLDEMGVAVEKDVSSEDGAQQQLYFRDPAGNSVELVAGELWPPG